MPKNNKKPSFSSFFAGIGGFDLGMEKNGFAPRFQCEVNDFCLDVLRKHWPEVSIAEDIRELRGMLTK